MKELGEALKSIFDKIGVFLDLFDLSFFISGATACAGLGLLCWQWNLFPQVPLPGWMEVTLIIIATYVAGMVCFAVGRFARQTFTKTARATLRGKQLKGLLTLHGLDKVEPVSSYMKRAELSDKQLPLRDPAWALYTRVWAGIRHDPALAPSLTLLNRYWVMAATYDGLAVALITWGAVLGLLQFSGVESLDFRVWLKAAGFLAGGVVCAVFCSREAGRYTLHQLGELAATIAAAQKPQ